MRRASEVCTTSAPEHVTCRYGKGRRGAIMGVWNAHTSVGNIGGSLVGAAALGYGWGWAFVVPGAALVAAACLIWLLLAAEPEEAGLQRDGTSELQVLTLLHFTTYVRQISHSQFWLAAQCCQL